MHFLLDGVNIVHGYLQEDDSVLCLYYATSVQQKMSLPGYATKLYRNWIQQLAKDITQIQHEQSTSHRCAVDRIMKSSKYVGETLLIPKRRLEIEMFY